MIKSVLFKMRDLIQKALEKLNRKGDGDAIDRLSATTTVTMLTVASICTSAFLMLAQPIHCYIPAEMSMAMKDYIENYCYIQDTYFLPFDQPVLRVNRTQQRKGAETISYYQWVPFILLLQAAMFYTPRLFWRATSDLSGVNYNAMLKMAHQCLICEGDKREHGYRALADYITWALNLQRADRRRSSCWEFCNSLGSLYLIVVFLVSKMLYVANAVGQIFLLDALLQTRDPLFGISMIQHLANGSQWKTSGRFPRSILCDVEIRETLSGNLHPYTIQCVLVTNVFNEKLFIFLWFWTMFVAMASSCNLIYYLITTFLPGNRRRFIRRLLPDLPVDKDHPLAGVLPKFVDDRLGAHGVFLLRSISGRVGSVVASKVATHMWTDFINQLRAPMILAAEWKGNGNQNQIGGPSHQGLLVSAPRGSSQSSIIGRSESNQAPLQPHHQGGYRAQDGFGPGMPNNDAQRPNVSLFSKYGLESLLRRRDPNTNVANRPSLDDGSLYD